MPPTIVKTRITDRIFLLRFDTQYELASTFLRFQEHYESSRFCGRVFSLEQYMDWYAARYGAFTYFEDWSGFNVPSTSLERFKKGEFDPLTRKEQRFLHLFRREREPFYVIGVMKKASRSDFQHELAHALFFTDPTYRKAVQKEMSDYNTSSMERSLARMSYAKGVLKDEVHAYLIDTGSKLEASQRHLTGLRRKLREIFQRHTRSLSVR